jgi:hypothetical protein
MGHSAGSITAILAAGGSLAFGVAADRRVSAVLTMGMISNDVIDQTDTENVTVPALFFAGALDANTPPATSLRVYNEISSVDKAHITLSNTVHRTFSSSFCDQMQASGSATLANPVRGILDQHTLANMIGNPINGSVLDYCPYEYFTTPIDIVGLVSSLSGGFVITESSVPRAGVSSDNVAQVINELAVVFFGATLEHKGEGRLVSYFGRKLVKQYESLIGEIQYISSLDESDE